MSWIPCAICVGAAIYMVSNDVEGWGWFLFVAVLISPAISK